MAARDPVRQTWWEQCLDMLEEEEEEEEAGEGAAVAAPPWHLPVPLVPQVPRGPRPEEDAEADRCLTAAHVPDYKFTV